MRIAILFLYLFSSALYSQSSIIYESTDFLYPKLLTNNGFKGKDSAKKLSFFVLKIGAGYNELYYTKPQYLKSRQDVHLSTVENGWLGNRDSINFMFWMNAIYYIKNWQFNVKAKYFLSDTSHTDLLRFQTTKVLFPEVQCGYVFCRDETYISRIQLNWEPEIYNLKEVDNIMEANFTLRNMFVKNNVIKPANFLQGYFKWDESEHTYYYGAVLCPSILSFKKNPIIRGVDFEFGYSRFVESGVDKDYSFSAGFIGEFLYRHHSSNLYGFIDWSSDYFVRNGNTLFHFGIFFEGTALSEIFKY